MSDHTMSAAAGEGILGWLDTAITVREQSARRALTDPTVVLGRCASDRKQMLLHGAPHVCPTLGAGATVCSQLYGSGECDTLQLLAEGYGWTEGDR